MKKLTLIVFLNVFFLVLGAAAFAQQTERCSAEIFAAINGRVGAGIVCDNRSNMFVSKNDDLLKITPDGKVSQFSSLADLPKGNSYYFPSPLIWGMVFDKEGNIVAAAQDRI
jgi:hypothetical protein